MSTRTAPHHSGYRGAARAGVLGAAVLVSMGLGLSSAVAAPITTIPLDPPGVELYVHSTQNYGSVLAVSPVSVGALTPIASGYGGSVTFTVPPELTFPGALPEVALELSPTADDGATKTYDSTSAIPADQLTVTDLGAGTFEVDIPTDNGIDGDVGTLYFADLGPDAAVVGSGIMRGGPPMFILDLAAGVTAPVNLDFQLVADAFLSCWDNCPDATRVAPGSFIDVTLPPTSRLSAGLGITDFSASAFSLIEYDSAGNLTGRSVALSAAISPDGMTAAINLPANLPGEFYDLEVVLADGSGDIVSVVLVDLDVAAAPADSPETPAQNVGLRSNTGWVDGGHDASSTGAAPLIAVGAAMALAGGVGAGAVLRTRRRVAIEE